MLVDIGSFSIAAGAGEVKGGRFKGIVRRTILVLTTPTACAIILRLSDQRQQVRPGIGR